MVSVSSRAFAARLRSEAGPEAAKQVELTFHLTTGRKPTEKETKRGVALISALLERDGATPELALESFCLVALNLNEFLYLD